MSNNDIKELIDIAFGILIVFDSILWLYLYYKLGKIYDELKEIRKEKGKWIKHTEYGVTTYVTDKDYECSECHHKQPDLFNMNFCPNCGADMRGESK